MAILLVLAVGMLLASGVPVGADSDGTIDYPENGTGPVATYTATDPEGRPIYWSLLGATPPDGAKADDDTAIVSTDWEDHGDFSISADGVLTFNLPPDHENADDEGENNKYNIVVVASDDAPGAGTPADPIVSAYKKVVVTVTDEDEPGVVTLSSRQPQVGVPLTATLTDQEVDSPDITWKWEKSTSRSSGWTAIDEDADAVTYTPVASTKGNYLRATATYKDADNDERKFYVVSVNRVREAPMTTDEDATFPSGDGENDRSVNENSPAGTNVGKPVAANDTTDDVLTYSLTSTNTGGFVIDPATGQITVGTRTVLDTEATPSYSVTVTVTEASGDTTDQPVTITVKDVNEAPMVTEGVTTLKLAEYDADTADTDKEAAETTAKTVSTYTASDPESTADEDACTNASAGSTCSWDLEGADAADFMIGADGALTFMEAPNYEMPADSNRDNTYNVTVVTTDNGVPTTTNPNGDGKNKLTAKRAVVIMVTNAEENGTVELTAQQPKIGVAIKASVTDIDGGVKDVTWKWERDDDPESNEGTESGDDPVTIKGATMATYTPTADDDGKYLRAIASYTDGKGKDTSMATTAAVVAVRTDNPPKFDKDETGKRSIAEDMTGNVYKGNLDDGDNSETDDPVRATDADGGLLTYSLTGADAGSFTITSDTTEEEDHSGRGGQISVKSGVKLNYETKKSYMVTVTATDPDNHSTSIDVTINVTDVNEAPEITVGGLAISGSASLTYAENGEGHVASYTAAGPNAARVMWTLAGADEDDFRVSANGELLFRTSPDFENPMDADMDNTYMVTLKANDGTYMATRDVTVTVTNVEDTVTTGDGLLQRYDDNNSGSIDKDEMIAAINDRLFGEGDDQISKEDMIKVINLYLFG